MGTHVLISNETLPGGSRSMDAGDIVDVRPASMPFGNKESYPFFIRVFIPDAEVSELRYLAEPVVSNVHAQPGVVLKHRKYGVRPPFALIDAAHPDTDSCSCGYEAQVVELDKATFLGLVSK